MIGVARGQSSSLLPFALTLVAAAGWAFGNVCARVVEPDSALRLVLWMSVVPPVPLFVLSFVVEGLEADRAALAATLSGQAWPAVSALFYIVVLATLVGSGLWATLLSRHPTSAVASYSLLIPVVGITAAWALLDQVPTTAEFTGAIVVYAGELLASTSPRGRRDVAVP